ncbi:hypothetical protein HK105_200125 [Polyrhizophydium stewartii]|uniref:Uncharacterized protein n=1 Tax=Polyrhizophydium stewartii TaxID=2732419 RepID=A0ABR4NKV6_9FUNG
MLGELDAAVSAHLGVPRRRSRVLAIEVLSVALGIRPAVLNDFAAASRDAAVRFVREAAQIHPVLGGLRCVWVDGPDFLFVVSAEAVAAQAVCSSVAFVDLEERQVHCVVPLTGLLLGYPVVLAISDPQGNCLSMVPLRLFEIHATLSASLGRSAGRGAAEQVQLLSFTVPEQLLEACRPQIDSFLAAIAAMPRQRHAGMLEDIHVVQTTVVKPQVVM